MRIHAPGEPLLDPFYASLRRRHPDVDIVLLAPEPPETPPDAAGLVPDELVVAVRDQVADLFVQLWDLAGVAVAVPPRVALHRGSRGSDVVVVVRASSAVVDDGAALDRIVAGLRDHGWEVQELAGGVRRVTAAFEDLDVTATYADSTGVLVVTAASRPLPVGADRARALVREAHRSQESGGGL